MRMLPKRFDLDNVFDNFMNSDTDLKCDVYEKDGNYIVEADMPGLDKDNVKVEYDNGYLTLTATLEDSKDKSKKNYIRHERFYGTSTRSFYVGDIDESKIKAEFKHGVLKVTLPEEKTKKSNTVIEIK